VGGVAGRSRDRSYLSQLQGAATYPPSMPTRRQKLEVKKGQNRRISVKGEKKEYEKKTTVIPVHDRPNGKEKGGSCQKKKVDLDSRVKRWKKKIGILPQGDVLTEGSLNRKR